jgi:hypothetical protein
MPRIVIIPEVGRQTAVPLLSEHVAPCNLESDHYASQLLERVGWAIVDADEVERDERSPTDHLSATPS